MSETKQKISDIMSDLKNIKDSIKELNDQVKQLKGEEAFISGQLIQRLEEQGITRTHVDGIGTISVVTEALPDINDWDQLYSFIQKNGLFEFLHKRVSATAAREYVQTYESIPGVGWRDVDKLNFRKS